MDGSQRCQTIVGHSLSTAPLKVSLEIIPSLARDLLCGDAVDTTLIGSHPTLAPHGVEPVLRGTVQGNTASRRERQRALLYVRLRPGPVRQRTTR